MPAQTPVLQNQKQTKNLPGCLTLNLLLLTMTLDKSYFCPGLGVFSDQKGV
jgi:hypothetical protein